MKKLPTLLLAAGMLALGACGDRGGETNVADAGAENVAVPVDDLSLSANATATDTAASIDAGNDTVGEDLAPTVDTGNSTDGNKTDDNPTLNGL